MGRGKKGAVGYSKQPGIGQIRESAARVKARESVQAARAEVKRQDLLIIEMRRHIEAARAKDPAELSASFDQARSEMQDMEAQIERDKELAKQRKREIDEWQQWYHQLTAIDRSVEWARVEYEAGWRLAEINELEKRISQAEAARIQKFGELQAVEHDRMAHDTGIGELSVEKDLRMEILDQTRRTALESLRAAEGKLRRTK